MAVKISRTGWMQLFTQMRSPNMFLSRMFKVRPGNIYKGKTIAIDIVRAGEDVAVVIKDCTGHRLNDIDEFTTKEFEPPVYGEAVAVDVCELLNRLEGLDPYSAEAVEYASQLAAIIAKGFRLISDKINRAVELQASQILQTGTLNLLDENGNTAYSVDFSPKATHFPTVGTSWSAGTADIQGDLESLAEVIRADGKIDPNVMIMGSVAYKNFINDDTIQKLLDNRRMDIGGIFPQFVNSGATSKGEVWIGDYNLAIFTYPETYKDPQTGNVTKYVEEDKVIMLRADSNGSMGTRLDMTSAAVPLPLGPDPRTRGLLPSRLTSRSEGFDVTPNLYPADNSGEQILASLKSKPMLIPVQIDGFGCLDTEI